MPTYQVTDPETGRTLRLTGDSPPTEAELNDVFSQLPPRAQPEQAAPRQQKPLSPFVRDRLQNQELVGQFFPKGMSEDDIFGLNERFLAQKESGATDQVALRKAAMNEDLLTTKEIGDTIAGVPSAALTIGSGALGDIAGGVAGLATAAIPGLEQGSGAGVVQGVKDALTVQPSERGKMALGAIGEAAAPLVEPFAGAGQAAGEKVADVTGSPLAGALTESVVSSAPDLVGGGLALKSAGKSAKAAKTAKDVLKQRIEAGDADVDLLGKTARDGSVVTSPGVAKAQKQGFDDLALRSIETANPETKSAMRDMLKTLKKRRVNADFKATNRVTDTIGSNLNKRYQALNDLKRSKGKSVGRAAESLKGKEFSGATETKKLFSDLRKQGVNVGVDEKGRFKADYSGLDTTSPEGTKKAVDSILSRINRTKRPDAYSAHKMKKLVSEPLEFNKLPTADTKLTSGVDNALKSYRASINESLAKAFPNYGKANAEFKEATTPLEQMDTTFKSILNNSSKDALDAGLGTKAARTIMSNNTGRAAMLDTIKNVDEVLAKNNVKFNDSIIKQSVAADELERFFGSEATTSLGGSAERAVRSAIQGTFGLDMATEATVGAINKLRKINPEEAIKALEDVLGQSKPVSKKLQR